MISLEIEGIGDAAPPYVASLYVRLTRADRNHLLNVTRWLNPLQSLTTQERSLLVVSNKKLVGDGIGRLLNLTRQRS